MSYSPFSKNFLKKNKEKNERNFINLLIDDKIGLSPKDLLGKKQLKTSPTSYIKGNIGIYANRGGRKKRYRQKTKKRRRKSKGRKRRRKKSRKRRRKKSRN